MGSLAPFSGASKVRQGRGVSMDISVGASVAIGCAVTTTTDSCVIEISLTGTSIGA